VKKAIRLASADNVATLLSDADKSDWIEVIDENRVTVGEFKALQAIPSGNKIALGDIGEQQVITKAGYPVGCTVRPIESGDLVHVQNVRSARVDIPQSIIGQIIQQMQIEC
jgi:hypothetical protein